MAKPLRCQLQDPQRGFFAPMTTAGKTRKEMLSEGPFRPGKTRQDRMKPESRPRFRAPLEKVR